MRDPSGLDVPCELLLNGVSVRRVAIRQPADAVADFDVVFTDPVLGSFSLHSGFDIDMRELDLNWRRVSLEELKGILRRSSPLRSEDLPKASEIAESRLFARVDDIEIPHWQRSRLSSRGREECVHYVQRIFYRVGIPHLVAGTTFTVPSAATARIPLKRAGFRESEISRSALIEPRTGCAIQVIERDPQK
jgi:hypothetical protein